MAVIERPDGGASWGHQRRGQWRMIAPLVLWAVVAVGLWLLVRYGTQVIYPT